MNKSSESGAVSMETMTEEFCDQIQPGKKNAREYGCIKQIGHGGRHVSGRNVNWKTPLDVLPTVLAGTCLGSVKRPKVKFDGEYGGIMGADEAEAYMDSLEQDIKELQATNNTLKDVIGRQIEQIAELQRTINAIPEGRGL